MYIFKICALSFGAQTGYQLYICSKYGHGCSFIYNTILDWHFPLGLFSGMKSNLFKGTYQDNKSTSLKPFRLSIRPNAYLLKVNNRDIRTSCKISSKLTTKTPERRQWRCSSVLLYLNIFYTLF